MNNTVGPAPGKAAALPQPIKPPGQLWLGCVVALQLLLSVAFAIAGAISVLPKVWAPIRYQPWFLFAAAFALLAWGIWRRRPWAPVCFLILVLVTPLTMAFIGLIAS